MKIQSLTIENIASLKGIHHIDFENIEQHSGVFAITGETGSGKSTILNCISLALYGQHYKKSNNQKDFVTLGETAGRIELIYKIHQEYYKSYWYFRMRKADGTLLKNPKPDRQYFQFINDDWTAIKQTPEEILNLSFEQFTKTIILNQGEFAKFLTSSFKDRKDILSKLYEGEKLDELSLNVRKKITALVGKIENLNYQIQGITENTNFDMKEASKLIDQLQKDETDLLDISALMEKNKSYFMDLINLHETWFKNKTNIERAQSILTDITNQFNALKIQKIEVQKEYETYSKKVEEKEPVLIECIGKLNLIENLKIQLNKLYSQDAITTKEISKEQEHLEELAADHNNLAQKLKTLTEDNTFSPIAKEQIITLDEVTTQYQKFKHQKELQDGKLQILNHSINELSIRLNKIQNRLAELVAILRENSLPAFELQLNELQIDYDNSQQTLFVIDNYIKSLKALNDEQNVNKKLLEETNIQIKVSREEQDEYSQHIVEIELALKSYILQEYVDKISQESINKGECLVCHSNDLSNIKTSSTSTNCDQNSLQKRLEKKKKLRKECELKVESLRSSQAHYRAIDQKIILQKKEIEQSVLKIDQNLNLELLQKEPDNVKQSVTEKITALKSQKEQLTIKIQQLHKVQEEKNLLNQNLMLLNKDYKTESESYQKATQTIQMINSQMLNSENVIIELTGKSTAQFDIKSFLTKQREYYHLQQRIMDNRSTYSKASKLLNDLLLKQKNVLKDINQLKSEKKLHENFILHQSSNNPKVELEELKHSFKEKQARYDSILAEINLQSINIAENKSRIQNYHDQCEQTENVFTITSQKQSELASNFFYFIQENNIKDTEFLEQTRNLMNKTKNILSIKEIDIDILMETSNVNDHLTSRIKKKLDHCKEKLTKYRMLVEQKKNAENKIQQINKKISQLSNDKNELEDLYQLVGKDEFRNFVLALIEKNLITQTNHELKNLCDDRYIIQHFNKNKNVAPDFYVIDKFKAGLTRKVSTLSGGETFMVSLAMAIALAELTKGGSEVDSFFIDEGFGTLDEESLEEVLEMIHIMEQRGKSIGIISHIKKLTDRIGVNILLNKSNLGNSTISICYN